MNVYDIVTQSILDALKQGTVPWRQPWRSGVPTNLISHRAYRGLNNLILAWTCNSKGYASQHWVTYHQMQDLGGELKPNEHATPILFWKRIEDEDDPDQVHVINRFYRVFNLDQIAGIAAPEISTVPFNPIEHAERIIAGMPSPPEIRFKGDRAFYAPSKDLVQVPDSGDFETPEDYYLTLFHELGHSTGHQSRLARFNNDHRLAAFGSEDYSKEELIAELTAAFLAAEAGFMSNALPQSASYINGWLNRLKGDPKLLVQASACAQKAADFVLASTQLIDT